MNKNNIAVFFFVLTRLGDLLSTYLASGDTLEGETNVLVTNLNFSWTGLAVANVIFIIILHSLSNEKYLLNKEEKYKAFFTSYKRYLQYIFFNEEVDFVELFFKKTLDYKVYIFLLTYTLPTVLTIANILIIINNLLAWQGNSILKNVNPDSVIHINVFISLLILVIIQLAYLNSRFRSRKDNGT